MSEPHNEEMPGNRVWPQPSNSKLLITVVLTTSIAIAAVFIGYTVSQLPGGVLPPTAQDAATQREADQRQAQQQAQQQQAEQRQASAPTSQEATIAEGRLVSAHVAKLKAMRSELSKTMVALNKKAKSSASASREWDRLWARRRARYASRYAAVRAHNYRERQRYQAGKVETANSEGKLVVKYTYRPSYWSYPARPGKPAPLRVSVASQTKRLSRLRRQIEALRSSVASEGPAAKSFGSVYPVLASTAQALEATVSDARSAAGAVVVTRGAKGRVIDASKISKVKQGALDAPFDELDRSFSDALTAVGLTPGQVAADGVGAP